MKLMTDREGTYFDGYTLYFDKNRIETQSLLDLLQEIKPRESILTPSLNSNHFEFRFNSNFSWEILKKLRLLLLIVSMYLKGN